MRRFDGERTSYLSWARANDDEAYREAQARRRALGLEKPKKRKPTIELYEYTTVVERLSDLVELAQQQVFYTATHGTRAARKKPKVARLPRPTTAAKRVARADQRQALETVESLVVFTDEPYADRPDLVQQRAGRPEDYADVVETQPEEPRLRPGRMRPPDPRRAQDPDVPPFSDQASAQPDLPPLFTDSFE